MYSDMRRQPADLALEGVVRKWVDARGFGFITHPDFPKGVFVHVSETGGNRLAVGERVAFEAAGQGERVQAVRVRRLGRR